MEVAIYRFISALSAAIAIVAVTVGLLCAFSEALANENLSANCASCVNSGDTCSSANFCPVKACKDCICADPANSKCS
jgi:hypothetical protein